MIAKAPITRRKARQALVVLAVWTAIVLAVSLYKAVDPGHASRIPALIGIVAGVIGLFTVILAFTIQRRAFWADDDPK
jgi:hypothetical protein